MLLFFFPQEAELRLVKHLPSILMLQGDLVKKFQNISVTVGTIEEFLHSQKKGTETDGLHLLLCESLNLFNLMTLHDIDIT